MTSSVSGIAPARWALLVVMAAVIGCEPRPRPEAQPSGNQVEPIYDPAAGGEGRVAAGDEEPAPPSQCKSPSPSAELRVGFRMAVKRGASELIASEAPRILSVLQARLCELTAQQDPEGSLRTALGAGLPLEISALSFTRKDGSRAEAHVQLVSEARANPDGTSGDEAAAALIEPPRWLLKLVRANDSGWSIVSAAAK